MEALLAWCIEHLNYWTITLLMAIESSFIPFPSEVVVMPAGYFAAEGRLDVTFVVLCATLGALIGALFNYFLSKWIGRPLVYKFAKSKLAHLLLIDETKIEKSEVYFDKHGALSTLIGRLVPVIRQLISIPAGLARMNIYKFMLYTTLGALIWNCTLAAIGFWMHSFVPLEQLQEAMAKYNSELKIVGFALGAIVIIYFVLQTKLNKKR